MTAEHELDSPRRVDAASGLVVRIDDLDAHFEQAVAAGARIESEPRDMNSGFRQKRGSRVWLKRGR